MAKTNPINAGALLNKAKQHKWIALILLFLLCCSCSFVFYSFSPPQVRLRQPSELKVTADKPEYTIYLGCVNVDETIVNDEAVDSDLFCYEGYDVVLKNGVNTYKVEVKARGELLETFNFEISFDEDAYQKAETERTENQVVNDIKSRVKGADKVEVIELPDGGYRVNAELQLTCISLDQCQTSASINTGEVFYSIFTNNNPEVTEAIVAGRLEVVDKFGNESNPIAYQAKMGLETVEQINWTQNKSLLEVSILPDLWEQQKNSLHLYF